MSEHNVYVRESDDVFYLPVEHYTLNQARAEASRHAGDTLGGWGRAKYQGKRDVALHDCGGDWYDCQACPTVPAWVFEAYEGTWRG